MNLEEALVRGYGGASCNCLSAGGSGTCEVTRYGGTSYWICWYPSGRASPQVVRRVYGWPELVAGFAEPPFECAP
jgi:hypothetical protein